MHNISLLRSAGILAIGFLPLVGCAPPPVTYSASMACNITTGQCTVTVGISIGAPKPQDGGLAPTDFSNALASGYSVTYAVPSGVLVPSSSPVQTTLTGTTDTGFTSAITETLTYTGSAPDSTYSGYTDYIFSVPASQALTTWVQTVNANTISASSLSTSTNGVFTSAGGPGNYTAYVTISSTQTGAVPVGSLPFTLIPHNPVPPPKQYNP